MRFATTAFTLAWFLQAWRHHGVSLDEVLAVVVGQHADGAATWVDAEEGDVLGVVRLQRQDGLAVGVPSRHLEHDRAHRH